jgi:hypothetical protein
MGMRSLDYHAAQPEDAKRAEFEIAKAMYAYMNEGLLSGSPRGPMNGD